LKEVERSCQGTSSTFRPSPSPPQSVNTTKRSKPNETVQRQYVTTKETADQNEGQGSKDTSDKINYTKYYCIINCSNS
jgi:hypothetical protein